MRALRHLHRVDLLDAWGVCACVCGGHLFVARIAAGRLGLLGFMYDVLLSVVVLLASASRGCTLECLRSTAIASRCDLLHMDSWFVLAPLCHLTYSLAGLAF